MCPPGCDQALFEQACELREKRLDLEEIIAEEKKTSDALKKEYDALVKKSKVIDSGLKTAEADLEAFQVIGYLFPDLHLFARVLAINLTFTFQFTIALTVT